MSNVEQTIERVRNMVSESEKIVILLGVGTLIESGKTSGHQENVIVWRISITRLPMR